jgi:hypothetical protein
MEILFIYLLKSSGLVTLFFLAYYFLLRKETFFTSNRWFLLVGLITSALLPLLVLTKTVWVEPSPATIDCSRIPVAIPVEKTSFEIDWLLTVGMIYAIGIVAFLIRFGFDYYSLTKVFKGKTVHQQANFRFIDVNEKLAPFSFFNTIVYNSALYSASELENIIEHEKVHSEQNHTMDVLLTRIFSILFWFNPVIWLYQKVILQNLEFVADREALLKILDKKAYQITLLKITTHENCVALSNHFYQSLIRKRIVMLNKNQSKKRNFWKYSLVVPALVAFVMLFQIEVIAQEKNSQESSKALHLELEGKITKNSTDKDFVRLKELYKKELNIDLNISKVKRNSKNEIIAIKVRATDGKTYNTEHHIQQNKPIVDFIIKAKKDTKGKIEVLILSTQDSKEEEEITSANILIPEAAVKKYGSEEQNAVVEVSTGKPNTISNIKESKVWINNQLSEIPNEDKVMIFNQNQSATQLELNKVDPTNLIGEKTSKTTRTIKIIRSETNRIPENVSYFIDGKKTSKEEVDKIDPHSIESMKVLKGESALEKYGKDAENGAIEIITVKK